MGTPLQQKTCDLVLARIDGVQEQGPFVVLRIERVDIQSPVQQNRHHLLVSGPNAADHRPQGVGTGDIHLHAVTHEDMRASFRALRGHFESRLTAVVPLRGIGSGPQ